MGWVNRLLGLGVKRVTNNQRWSGATVTPQDIASRHSSAKNREAMAMVARATQWVEVCARRNATECASQVLRLYVPISPATRALSTRKIKSVGRLRAIRDPRCVGVKTAGYAEMAGDIEEVTDHPALELLRQPNPWQMGVEFMHSAFYALEITGNRYWHVVMDPAGPQLYTMAPQYTRVLVSDRGFVDGYVYGRNGVVEERFETDEVIHQRFYPSLSNPYYGVGPLAAMFGEADLDAACLASETALWQNGSRPDWSMTFPPETPQTTLDAIEAKLEGKFRGPSNRGRFLLTSGAEPKPLMFSAKEMEYIAGIANIERRIWGAFGLPESEVRLNDSNLASSVSGNRQYLRQTIKPRCQMMAECLTATIMPLFNIEPGEMFFAYDEVVPADDATTAVTMTSLVGGRILTRNEARAELGYDPVDGGDAIEEPAAPVFGSSSMDGQQQDGADQPDRSTGKTAATRKTKAAIQAGIELVHGMFADRAAAAILDRLNSIVPELAAGAGVFDSAKLFAALDAAIDSFSFPAMQVGASAATQELGQMGRPAGSSVSTLPSEAVAALRRRSVKVAGDVTSTLGDEIASSLASAIEAGASREDAIRAVAETLPDRNVYRAEMIADTEISRSYHAGNAVVYRQAGIKRLEWVTVADPCPICETASLAWNAKAMPIDRVFDDLIDGGYATLDDPRPPQHPRCRCTLLPVIPEEWGKP